MSVNVLALNEVYYSTDHWQTWIGPRVSEGDASSRLVMREVERIFQEANKVRECVDRHRRALCGKPASWTLMAAGQPLANETAESFLAQQLGWMIPRSARRKLVDRGNLTGYLNNPQLTTQFRGVYEPIVFPNAIAEAMHNRLLGGDGYLRLWKPARAVKGPAYRQVAIHAPHPSTVEFLEDDDGFPYRVRYQYQSNQIVKTEVQELRDDGKTYFWIEGADGGIEVGSEFALDLGGRFTIARLRGSPIVNHSIRRLQDGLNYVLTLMVRNLQLAGFLRDIVTNGMPPGDYDENGQFIPDPRGWVEGPGQKLEIRGIPIYDAEGNITGYTTPGINTRDPVDVEPFIKAIRAIIALIYEQFGQAHILGSDLTLSGVSRQQLRADFMLALQEDASDLRVGLSDTYACSYILAGNQVPQEFAVQVNPDLAIADPTPDEISGVLAVYGADLLSKRTSMQMLGIENPDSEMDAIRDERLQRLARREVPLDELLDDDE